MKRREWRTQFDSEVSVTEDLRAIFSALSSAESPAFVDIFVVVGAEVGHD